MNKESAFSVEYEINNTTDSKSTIQNKSSAPKDKEMNDFIKKIKSDYKLSKPRRKSIRARIIPK
ncbi:MAG: hypothetical protein K8R79_01835 [Calditrichales bacterium]|nr:hypothetical protein [Calditrichales bacterium]